MKTTTREKYIRTDDIYYDGIEWGTRIGSIQFVWIDNDTKIEVYHNGELIHTSKSTHIHEIVNIRLLVNKKISDFLKGI
jgi:hypothetical protein